MNVLVVLNDPPYGTERSYNGLRLAGALSKREETHVRVFLLGDAVGCAMAGQTTPNGYYQLDRMIRAAADHDAEVGCCGTCMDARGITDDMLVGVSRRSSMDELADWTLWADNVLVF
ncbi:MAG: DsrE/DsrF/TusD sulfur relay family protein [Actinomycetota bacterium]